MKTVLFYNDWHNGDIHMSREYVKDLMSIIKADKYYYHHKNNPSLLKDIENLEHTNEIIKADLYINTWMGQFMKEGIPFAGPNFPGLYDTMTRVYDRLNISDKLKNISYYVPSIDYTKINTQNIDKYFESITNSILICNNDTKSGQTPNFPFTNIINELSQQYLNLNFILTNKDDSIIKTDNVLFAYELISDDSVKCDLNEISYISTLSNIIVGRSSGPYSFSIVKENMKNKPLVCFTNLLSRAWFLDGSENLIWSNNYTESNIKNLIKQQIDEHMD